MRRAPVWYNGARSLRLFERVPMKFKMHERSLFSVLLRSPWWISLLVAGAIGLLAHLLLPSDYRMFGYTGAVPFAGIALIALYKQLQRPSATRVAAVLGAVQALAWRDFSALLEAAFARDGYGVTRIDLAAADFEITKAGRVALVSAKRWKAASHGSGPLEELVALRRKREAAETLYVSIGPLTENAERLAVTETMRVINGADLAVLLRDLPVSKPGK